MVRPQPTPAGISSSSIPLEDRQCIALLQTLNAVVHSFPREMAELLGRESIASRVLMIVLSLRVPIDVRMVVVSLVGRWRVVLAGNRIAGKRIEAIVDAFYLNTGHSPTPEFLPAIPELCRQQRGWIYPPMILVPGQPGFFYTTVPPVRLEPEPSHPQQRQPQHLALQQPAEPVLAPQPRSASQQAAAHTFASGGNVGGSAVAGKACMPESLTIEGVQAESSKAAAVRRVLEPTALVLATMAGSAAASGNSGGGSGSQQQLQSGLVRMSTKSRGKMPETD
ncbi:hypothetical protein LPJ61_004090 [Coemansia biformis]|uniref:Uncharacterized protein n=1 Tax=Coemansia biformis TaxID=1286918 RepID=A0A9W8CV12_9FUNG|nr:hypothetical protein LPJ61_004090 [Coemansia biformis]